MIELGLVGLPSSGKSTFFKAATLKDVKIASYPFTTIEPNEGLGYVKTECPCKELDIKNCNCVNGFRFVPIKIWDVAGLVEGAHQGKGRGNKFLDDLIQANGLIHVLDVSGKTDLEGNPTENFDVSKKTTLLEKEIDYWLLDIFKKDINTYKRDQSKFDEIFLKRFSGLGISKEHLKKVKQKIDIDIENEESMIKFMEEIRKISKPILVAANKIDIEKSDENLKKLDRESIPVSADSELALREAAKSGLIEYIPGESEFKILNESALSEKQKKALEFLNAFLSKNKTTGVQDCINHMVFNTLDMIVVYPVEDENKYTNKKGEILPDAFLVEKGTTAKEFAFKIHEDIGKNFIAAVDAKNKRKISADHELKHNDIVSIKFGR